MQATKHPRTGRTRKQIRASIDQLMEQFTPCTRSMRAFQRELAEVEELILLRRAIEDALTPKPDKPPY